MNWLVVVDTSILERVRSDVRSDKWKQLRRAAELGYCDVGLPGVVLDEAVSHRDRQLRKASDTLRAAQRDFNRLNPGRSTSTDEAVLAASPATNVDLKELVREFRRSIVDDIGGEGAILPYPSVSHRDMVHRVLTRRRPFSESEKGYRDALIWYTVLEHAQERPIVLFTGNTKDFAEADGRLAVDLVDDLRLAGLATDRVVIATDFAEVLDRVQVLRGFVDAEEGWLAVIDGGRLHDEVNAILSKWSGVPFRTTGSAIASELRDLVLIEVVGPFCVENFSGIADPERAEILGITCNLTCRGSFGAWEWHLAPGACEIGLSGPWTEGLVADLWKADAERIVRFTVEARFLPSGVIREVYLSNIRMVLQPGEHNVPPVERRLVSLKHLLTAASIDDEIAAEIVKSDRTEAYANIIGDILEDLDNVADSIPGRYTALAFDNLGAVISDIHGLSAMQHDLDRLLPHIQDMRDELGYEAFAGRDRSPDTVK